MSKPAATTPKPKISFVEADHAPIISFDEVPFFGTMDGVGRLTIAAQVFAQTNDDGTISAEHVITAHLRGSLRAMTSLRDTIDQLLMAAMPPTSGQQ